MRRIQDAEVKDKVVLIRVDYNVPMREGEIESDLRIRASVPTIRYLQKEGARRVILMSHMGRPKGVEKDLSLAPVAERLAMILMEEEVGKKVVDREAGEEAGKASAWKKTGAAPGDDSIVAQAVQNVNPVSRKDAGNGYCSASARFNTVDFVSEVAGDLVEEAVAKLPKGGILLLENLRFDPREKANDAEFAREIVESTGAEIFVEDGFSVCHRAAASTVVMAEILPSYAGLLVEKEVGGLSKAMEGAEKPLVAVIGGSKVEDKAPMIEKFEKMADRILVGGKIAVDIVKAGEFCTAGEEMQKIQKMMENPKIYVAEDFDEDEEGNRLDIGPFGAGKFLEELRKAKTVLWNGVLGKVEDAAFSTSSELVAKFLGEHAEIFSVICGGDTTGFVESLQEENPELKYGLVSTGGGAALEFLTGGEMPGLKVLG